MSLTYSDIQEILKLLDDTSFEEMHLEIDGLSLHLCRGGNSQSTVSKQSITSTQKEDDRGNKSINKSEHDSALQQHSGMEEGLVDIVSPMLGVFYCAPKPGAEPFVTIGQHVDTDSLVCIIEVMKLMNSIPAGVSGEVVEIHVEDGQMVEYGQLLFRVRVEQA